MQIKCFINYIEMKEYEIQKLVVGLVSVMLLVKILKRILRHPRPSMTDNSTYGMPSTRSASLFFMMVFLLLVHELSTKTIALMIGGVVFCCTIKYIMKEHSLEQLVAGAVLGSIMGYIVYLL